MSSNSAAQSLITAILRLYKKYISVLLGHRCRFYPSCSEYAALAVEKHGVFKGGFLALKRLVKCNPWGGKGGRDDVP